MVEQSVSLSPVSWLRPSVLVGMRTGKEKFSGAPLQTSVDVAVGQCRGELQFSSVSRILCQDLVLHRELSSLLLSPHPNLLLFFSVCSLFPSVYLSLSFYVSDLHFSPFV